MGTILGLDYEILTGKNFNTILCRTLLFKRDSKANK